jgi:glycosyltransferase involved in cell wall biosynthesis
MMNCRATVIIPTFGSARFARWAIRSVQQQTVRELEIRVIGDGSPPEMVSLFQALASEDPRLQFLAFPKAPRTGEAYRDLVIQQTTGRIICYCSHDDLWFPHHVQTMEKTLRHYRFAHSLHVWIGLPDAIPTDSNRIGGVHWTNIGKRKNRQAMFQGSNSFGLTFGSHTRESYAQLAEGWTTTPDRNLPTDLYMWQKFLAAYPKHCATIPHVTALSFPQSTRRNWSEARRDQELEEYSTHLPNPAFWLQIETAAKRLRPSLLRRIRTKFQRLKQSLLKF